MKIHTRLTWVSRLKKVIQQLYWLITFLGYNWGQSYSATLITPPNCKKMLRNLTFAVQFAYFSIRSKKVFVTFRATFVTKSNFWAPFLRNYKKIFFGKSRAACGKPYTLPYITDSFVCPAKMIHIFSVKLTRTTDTYLCLETQTVINRPGYLHTVHDRIRGYVTPANLTETANDLSKACLSRLALSATHVVICVSRAFCSRD